VNCEFSTTISSYINSCGIGLHGGSPSIGVCAICIKRGENNKELAKASQNKSTTTIKQMANSLSESMIGWAKSGFHNVTTEQLESRMLICKSCEFWEESGFAGTGKCKQCGCSTQAKLRMATSKCPIDKWGPVDVFKTD
jgi:hypothetical protein